MASNLGSIVLPRTCVLSILGLLIAGSTVAPPSEASQSTTSATVPASVIMTVPEARPVDLPFAIDGPPPPVAPAVISRDAAGRATIRAVRTTTPLRIDGRLDEALYTSIPSISDFIQQEPHEGSPATEKTELWITFDDKHLYVSIRCWYKNPEHIVGTELRRDNVNIWHNSDYVSLLIDTFYDRRNGFVFGMNPAGGRVDSQATDGRANTDFNPIWDLAIERFDEGWVGEAAIPFRSLRYRPGRSQIWGFNIRRIHRWTNESSSLVRLPASQGGTALLHGSFAAPVVGLEVPQNSLNLEVKPYAISSLASDTTATPRVTNDVDAQFGVDAKYGLTQNLTADFTYNTDFAQVEADEQQVNLTRFSLFFAEKRDFFLENQGTFAFGGVSSARAGAASDTPVLFYSRRIGLQEGRSVPIEGGARLTGRIGRYTLGALTMQTGRATASNFSVVRVRRDVLRRSSIGAMFTGRSVSLNGVGTNEAYGLDGTFAFFENVAIQTYWAQTRTGGLAGKDSTSHRVYFDYGGDRYGLQLERLAVGHAFNPEVGFVRRVDMRRSFGQFRFSPRPQRLAAVRKFSGIGSFAYVENGAGRPELRNWDGEFAVEFHNSDRISVGYSNTYELLPQPFDIVKGVRVPVGGYDFATVRAGATLGAARPGSGSVSVEHGSFYTGHKTALTFTSGRAEMTSHLSVEPTVLANWVDLPEGTFTTHLVGSRVVFTLTPRSFVSALLQYHTGTETVAANVRLRWEYSPGSELFIVFNDQRDTLARRFPDLLNRSFIIKITRLLRF